MTCNRLADPLAPQPWGERPASQANPSKPPQDPNFTRSASGRRRVKSASGSSRGKMPWLAGGAG